MNYIGGGLYEYYELYGYRDYKNYIGGGGIVWVINAPRII